VTRPELSESRGCSINAAIGAWIASQAFQEQHWITFSAFVVWTVMWIYLAGRPGEETAENRREITGTVNRPSPDSQIPEGGAK
jgi:hypothetical protein